MDLSNETEAVFKYADEIIKRIFNHRPFIDAQLHTMVEHFDDDDQGPDIKDIYMKIDQKSKKTEPNDQKILNRCESLTNSLANIEKLEEKMENLLKSESTMENERNVAKREYLSMKNDEFGKFIENINMQMNEIDESYMNTKNELDIRYKNVNKKVNK